MFSSLCLTSFFLFGCNDDRKQEITPAIKPTNDATAMANEAWVLINQLDQVLYSGQKEQLQENIREPLRELSTRWRVEVKMTDAVTEGKYALCRKSLTSLDVWTRAVMDKASDLAVKQKEYERDKSLCKDALEHPELGNTSPK